MAVSIGQTATIERQGRFQQRSIAIIHLSKAIQEIGELLHVELITTSELLKQFFVTVMMGERMAITADANLWHRRSRPFVARVEGDDASGVRLESQHNDVIHCSQILTEPFQLHIAVQLCRNVGIDLGSRGLQPFLGALRADFNITHRRRY